MINITNKKELSALLSKKKTVFISPAWKDKKIKQILLCPGSIVSKNDGDSHYITANDLINLYKIDRKKYQITVLLRKDMEGDYPDWTKLHPLYSGNYEEKRKEIFGKTEIKPSAKKGKIEEVFWNKDSEYIWFCKWCGGIAYVPREFDICPFCNENQGIFNKNIGKVKLTEDEFQIEMIKEEGEYFASTPDTFYLMPGYEGYEEALKEIWKGSGTYKSAEEFFKEMDKQYNLSTPKKFNVKIGERINV